MAQISYGSITIVDVTDIGQFSVYPRANASKTQIYNPDAGSYMPNWDTQTGGTKVVISPVTYYAGRNITSLATYTWQRRNGGGAASALITGETVVGNTLEITKNVLADATGGLVTYVCTASYTVDGVSLQAIGEIDFSLVRQGSAAKIAKITGDNVFKINSNGNYINTQVTLNATVNHTSISAWKYYKPTDSTADALGYVVYPNSGTATTLDINNTDDPVVAAAGENGNGMVRIKLVTTDPNTFDIFTISILRDGADAQSSISAVLSNDDQMIPADKNGNPVTGAFADAKTTLTIYEGGQDRTSTWTIVKVSTGVTDSAPQNNKANITEMSGATGNVAFTCTKAGKMPNLDGTLSNQDYPSFTKVFSLLKVKAGADGVNPTIYSLEASSVVVNETYTYTGNTNTVASTTRVPGTVTFNAYQWNGTTKSDYDGRIQFYVNGSNTISNETSTNDNERSYDFSANTGTTRLRAVLYAAGSNNTELDSQTVIVVSDGSKGAQGIQGVQGINAVSLVTQNEADVIPCDTNGHPFQDFLIDIPFEGYQGTSKKATSVSAPALSKDVWGTAANITASTKNATASETGYVRYTIPTTATVPENGKITLDFSVTTDNNETVSISKIYTWTRSKAANDGANAVILTATTPDGTVFENGEGILTIKGTLYDGPAEATGVTYKYYNYSTTASPAGYVEITTVYNSSNPAPLSIATQNGKKVLKVKGTAVNGYASFKIDVTYNGHTYEQYVSLIDKTDPLQISVHSTIGTQIKNAQGVGCLYVRVTRDGTEIDPVPDNITAGIDFPQSPNNGDYFVKLTKPTGTGTFQNNATYTGAAQLAKYDGSSWVSQTSKCNYEWTYRNVNNVPLATNDKKPATSGQFIYIDGSLIQNKITADVKVTLNENNS